MADFIARSFFLLLMSCFCFPAAGTQRFQEPLRETELLGLVAGAALPENVVAEIQYRGLGFNVDEFFRSQMEKAGADPRVLAALASARAVVDNSSKGTPNKDLLEHLANAGKLLKSANYSEAGDELTAAVNTSFQSPENGFIMGQLLRLKQRWPEAAAAYAEVLHQDPNFPEVHTKVSFVLIRLGDAEGALREAKSALAITPENAEAHKFAGLALTDLRKYDAARTEFEEALRIKPDYETARLDMGILLTDV